MIKDRAKPHQALVALSKVSEPIYEQDVWASAFKTSEVSCTFYEALNTLRLHEYAVRSGPRGGYRWEITDKGRERLRNG